MAVYPEVTEIQQYGLDILAKIATYRPKPGEKVSEISTYQPKPGEKVSDIATYRPKPGEKFSDINIAPYYLNRQ